MSSEYGTANGLVSCAEAVPVCRAVASFVVEDDDARCARTWG